MGSDATSDRNEYVYLLIIIVLWMFQVHEFTRKNAYFRKHKSSHLIDIYRWLPGRSLINILNFVMGFTLALSFFALYMLRFDMSNDIFHSTFAVFVAYIFVNFIWMYVFFFYMRFDAALMLSLLQSLLIIAYMVLAFLVNSYWHYAAGLLALPTVLFDMFLSICCYVIAKDVEDAKEKDAPSKNTVDAEMPATPLPPPPLPTNSQFSSPDVF
jgi:hypothetical protein